jgi:hypothetical protein
MSKLALKDRVPRSYDSQVFADLFSRIEMQVNQLAEGSIYGRHASATAAPTLGNYVKSDIVWNSDTSVLGTAGGQYVILGWVCYVSGNPGTWAEMRAVTGT